MMMMMMMVVVVVAVVYSLTITSSLKLDSRCPLIDKQSTPDRNQKYILGVFPSVPSVPFLLPPPFLPFPPSLSHLGVSPPIYQGTGGVQYISTQGGAVFGAFRAQGTCLVAAHVLLFLLNEI